MEGVLGVVTVDDEVRALLEEGKTSEQIRLHLEQQGFSGEDVAAALGSGHSGRRDRDRKASRLLAAREVFDRIGYGSASLQFVNVLFWLSAQAHPYIIFIIGILNGLKTFLSVFFSNLMQAYYRLSKIPKNVIAAAGIVFGFSYLIMAFGLKIRSIWVFSLAFVLASVSVVIYGDFYQQFIRDTVRKERMTPVLRGIAHWGVMITAISLLFSGYLLDAFPMSGGGAVFGIDILGYLVVFEITAFAFILAGYVTSLIEDRREDRSCGFFRFMKQHHDRLRSKLQVYWSNKYIVLLTVASIVSGILQILITAYSGIAIYRIVDARYATPFFTLGIIYAIAIIASFTGPYFTKKVHLSTGLSPTMVFGTLLMAIFPLVLVYNSSVVAIAAALCAYVIGASIAGFGQGLLAQKLLSDEMRHHYFEAQSYVMIIPYLVLVPALAYAANVFSLAVTFWIVIAGLVVIVMPLYLVLVWVSQQYRL